MWIIVLWTKIVVECIFFIGRIAAEKKREKTDKQKCDASQCQSLNVSASNNLKSAKLVVAPAGFASACEYCIPSLSNVHLSLNTQFKHCSEFIWYQ